MNRLNLYIIAALVSFLIVSSAVYVVDQRQTALVLQFGEAVRLENKPGLKFKIPVIQDVMFFDHRIHNLHTNTTEVIASDQKTMRVDAFTKYQIKDALKFFQSAKDENVFKSRLSTILDSSLRQVLGNVPFKNLLSDDRGILMHKIQEIVNREALSFGVEVIDVRIMRADLPDKSREAVYKRMQTEREKEAKEIRAQGSEEGQKVRATAQKDKKILIANARKKGQILRGEGDATAIKSFAQSFGQDPEFFDFYRSMQAYRKTLKKDTASMILSPDSEFMKYFSKPKG